jgi:hypothetical protein
VTAGEGDFGQPERIVERFRENFRLNHARHRTAKFATWMECRSQGEPEINGLLARVTSIRQMRECMNRLLEV